MKSKTLLLFLAPLIVLAIAIWLWFKPPSSSWYDKEVSCRADLTSIATQLDMFRQEQGRYPSSDEGLDALVKRPQNPESLPRWHQYFAALPGDPWGHPYQYKYPGVRHPNGFDAYSLGPDGVPSGDDIYPSEDRIDH